jgi:hypothetical protein
MATLSRALVGTRTSLTGASFPPRHVTKMHSASAAVHRLSHQPASQAHCLFTRQGGLAQCPKLVRLELGHKLHEARHSLGRTGRVRSVSGSAAQPLKKGSHQQTPWGQDKAEASFLPPRVQLSRSSSTERLSLNGPQLRHRSVRAQSSLSEWDSSNLYKDGPSDSWGFSGLVAFTTACAGVCIGVLCWLNGRPGQKETQLFFAVLAAGLVILSLHLLKEAAKTGQFQARDPVLADKWHNVYHPTERRTFYYDSETKRATWGLEIVTIPVLTRSHPDDVEAWRFQIIDTFFLITGALKLLITLGLYYRIAMTLLWPVGALSGTVNTPLGQPRPVGMLSRSTPASAPSSYSSGQSVPGLPKRGACDVLRDGPLRRAACPPSFDVHILPGKQPGSCSSKSVP